MEALTNGTEDFLVDGLSFKLPPGASYVTDRESSTFWAVGSNSYTPVGGVKLIKFQLNGDDGNWLGPSSVVFQFELANTAAVAGANQNVLRPLGQPHLFFRRLRVLAGGQVVEDIQDFGRNSELLASLQNEFVRDNNDIQGFSAARWDSTSIQDLADFAIVDPLNITDVKLFAAARNYLPQIAPQKSKVVNFKRLCGLFNQSKHLPLKFVPITLEFELGEINDAIVEPRSYDALTGYNAIYTTVNTTNLWQIQNCCIKCDICTFRHWMVECDTWFSEGLNKSLISVKSNKGSLKSAYCSNNLYCK